MGFENIPADKCIDASEVLHTNADTMFNTAYKSSEISNYGIARSLMILGSEEYVKGCLLYLRSFGIRVLDVKEMGKALRLHKERHQVAMLFNLFKLIEGVANVRKYQAPVNGLASLLDGIKHYLNEGSLMLKVAEEVAEDLSWWDNANDFKNAGFYVDYKDGISAPSTVTMKDFEEACRRVADLRDRFKSFKLMIESAGSDKKRQELVEMINQGLLMKPVI